MTAHLDDGVLAEHALRLPLAAEDASHLATCEACRRAARDWQAIAAALAADTGAASDRPVGARPRAARWRRAAAAAACLAAVVGGALAVTSDSDGDPVGVTTEVTRPAPDRLRTGVMATEWIVDSVVHRTFTDFDNNVQLVQSGRALTIFRTERFTYIEVPGMLVRRTGGRGWLRIPRRTPYRPTETVPLVDSAELRRQGFVSRPIGSSATFWEKAGFGSVTVDRVGRVRQRAIRGFPVTNWDYHGGRPVEAPADDLVFDVADFAAAREILEPTLLTIPKP